MTKLFSHHIALKPPCLEKPVATWSYLTCISCNIETSNAATESDLLLFTHLICLLSLVVVSCVPLQWQSESERRVRKKGVIKGYFRVLKSLRKKGYFIAGNWSFQSPGCLFCFLIWPSVLVTMLKEFFGFFFYHLTKWITVSYYL